MSKINNVFTLNEDLDIFMLMYNLLEHSKNYSITSGRLWNYYRDDVNDAANYKVKNCKTITNKFFEYKTKIIGSTPNKNNKLNAKLVVPLKYLSNFWRSLEFLLINCEIEPDLSWLKFV